MPSSMPPPAVWAVVLVGPAASAALGVLVFARMWRRHERRILATACVLGALLFVIELFVLVSIGGKDAHLTVQNETSWPVELSALNVERQIIPAHSSKRLFVPAGPGWINGLIDDVVIVGGPALSTRVELHGVTGLERGTITISNESVIGGAETK